MIRVGRVCAPTALCAAAGLALSGCGSSSNAAAPQGSSGGHLAAAGLADNVSNGSANVTLAPGVVEIKRNDVANELTSVSPDGSTYTFNGTAGRVADLHTGSVMFLQGTSIRRVTSVSTSGGATVVATAPASLTDAISSGTVKFTQPVALAQGAIEPDAPTPPGDYVTTPLCDAQRRRVPRNSVDSALDVPGWAGHQVRRPQLAGHLAPSAGPARIRITHD